MKDILLFTQKDKMIKLIKAKYVQFSNEEFVNLVNKICYPFLIFKYFENILLADRASVLSFVIHVASFHGYFPFILNKLYGLLCNVASTVDFHLLVPIFISHTFVTFSY